MKKIAVLSAGNGGQALAADLALCGHDVALYDLPQFAPVIEAIRRRGNTIELQNKITGTAKIRLVTTDIAEALDGAEVVYFTAPSYGQKAFFDLAVPALSDGQVIVLMPGNYGTLALKAALREAGKDVLVAETDNLPYACAATEPGVVNVRGVKKAVTLAAFPAGDYAAVEAAVDGAFCTGWRKGENVLATSMSGVNMVVHCAPMLANAGRIESEGGHFEFYYAGMTPAVCRLIEATDRERLAVARAYGLMKLIQYKLYQLVASAAEAQTSSLADTGSAIQSTPEVLQAASIMFVTIPIIIIYPFLQKYFVQGTMIGAVKG